MCKNVTSQISNLMLAVRPTLVGIMTATNVPEATQTNVLEAYDAAQEALANWQSGNTATTIDEALNAALAVIQSLQNILPPDAEELLGIIIAAIEAVVGLVQANSTTDAEEQAKAADEALEKVQVYVPDFKLSFWDRARAELGDENVAADRYKTEWNKAVAVAPTKYATLKIA
jgi:hypothetical protein